MASFESTANTAAKAPRRVSTLEDFDLAFRLQMQEAIRNSAAAASTSTGVPVVGFNDYFRLYTKGIVVRDRKLGAIGVAIFNSSNNAVLEASEPLGSPEGQIMTDEVAELEAFVRGLEYALRLQIRIIFYTCVQFNIHSYFNRSTRPNTAKAVELVNRAILLKERFHRCRVSPSTKNAQIVLQLARSAIQKQPNNETDPVTNNCCICLEDVNPTEMLKFEGCQHRFCSSCVKAHVQFKVHGGNLPKCPQPKCGFPLSYGFCKPLLDRKTRDKMEQLVKENSIPAIEKVYCPSPRCSYLMSKSEALATQSGFASTSKLEVTACRCMKCHSVFCIRCKVTWHSNMSCEAFNIRDSIWNSRSDDARLKSLARDKKWRICPRCSHLIELAHGCNHISCRCGHQFCYACGRDWKRETCSCPLWYEGNIFHRRRRFISLYQAPLE
ncbi:hypothetical protein V2J09_000057 [Rumex salicifolius]